MDSKHPEIGPLFRVPVTIIIPLEIQAENNFEISQTLNFNSATPSRLFVNVPSNAAWVCKSKFFFNYYLTACKIQSLNTTHIIKYTVYFLQLLPHTATNKTKKKTVIFSLFL